MKGDFIMNRYPEMAVRKENGMNIANKTVLITGANRGIGRALVNEALDGGRKGFMRVLAAHCKMLMNA
jgi:FlaA1/EpsC-like NDP-sugar epimerase